jgi:Flp pilus assembly secretin CpaC
MSACPLAVGFLWLLLGSAAAASPRFESLLLGNHQRLRTDAPVERMSVGNTAVVDVKTLTSHELLVRGAGIGSTNVFAWLADGRVLEWRFVVQRDLSVLRAALEDIHPGIRVAGAPDRDAVILRGIVPTLRYARAAEAAARSYLGGGGGGGGAGARVTLAAPDTGAGAAAEGEAPPETFRFDEPPQGGSGVINLIQVEELPQAIEERIRAAIAPVGGERVTVRRIARGELALDGRDSFVLEGHVSNQVALVRVLVSAAQVVSGNEGASFDIQRVSDEAGGLDRGSATSAVGGTIRSSIGSFGRNVGGGGLASGAGGAAANVARATALSAAGGRLLSFIEVDDLPQVRVEVRLYEIDRTRLRRWEPELHVIGGDFDQPPLLPALTSTLIQGAGAAQAGAQGDDVQGAISMIGGALTGQVQAVIGHLAIDALFSLLVDEGIARALAQPSLLVLSGEPATFQVGGQIPIDIAIQTPSSGTDNEALLNSTVFAEFGIDLTVLPLVGPDDTVTLAVQPQVSQPDFDLTEQLVDSTGSAQSTTAFETRSVSTRARVEDGQALLVAGLLNRSASKRVSRTPGVAEIPGLGWLARAESEQAEDFELVVVVTPSIVRTPIPDLALWVFPDAEEQLERALGNSAAASGTPH